MAFTLGCIHVAQAATVGASSGWVKFTNSVSLADFVASFSGAGAQSCATFGNYQKSSFKSMLNMIYDDGYNCGDVVQGWQRPFVQAVCFEFTNDTDRQYYDNNLVGRSLEIQLCANVYWSGGGRYSPIYYFKVDYLPSRGNESSHLYVYSDYCVTDLQSFAINGTVTDITPVSGNMCCRGKVEDDSENPVYYQNFIHFGDVQSDDDCDDSRSSDDTQTLHFVISDGVSNVQTFDVNFNLSDGANQEIGLLSPVLSDSAFNALLNVWNSQTGCTARCQFISGTVRSSCRVKLVCKVYGQSLKVSPSLVPPFVQLNLSEYGGVSAIDRNLLIADFDPCQDTAISYSEDITSYIQGLQQNEDFTVGFSFIQVVPYKVVIENCTALTDYCCDDDESVPADDESLGGYTKPLIQGYGGGSSGGGGGDVDITCICTALSNINTTLSAFASANETALSGINDTLGSLNINVDNQCVCDNLEDIVDSLGSLKGSIDDKELSVTNNNTVLPPVNNVSVNPPVNNVSVNPPVNNVSVSVPTTELASISTNLSSIDDKLHCNNKGIACIIQDKHLTDKSDSIGIDFSGLNFDASGIESSLQDVASAVGSSSDSLTCDDKGLACILKEALNTSDIVPESVTDVISNALNTSDDVSESITDVIKNKEMGTNIDVEVSPADDVNINRVYYTNQRNGDTNI